MTAGHVTTESGYLGVVLSLARQALAIATDAAPHRAPQGEKRWPMANALPAARILLDTDTPHGSDQIREVAATLLDTLTEPTGKTTDGFGHHRPAYAWLALHLIGTAARRLNDTATLNLTRQAAEAMMLRHASGDQADPRLAIWRRLIARQHRIHEAEELPLATEPPAPLLPLGHNDLIDAWTYHELVGLHALNLCASLDRDQSLAKQVKSTAQFHLAHTQPDYTTYQPWALAAFAADPHTALFAEQQLHDVATHLRLEGAGGAVLPALLLADAAATLNGNTTQAWS